MARPAWSQGTPAPAPAAFSAPSASPLSPSPSLPAQSAESSAPLSPEPGETPEPSPNPNQPKVKVRADSLKVDRASGITTFLGNVHVDYGTTTIDSEALSVDQNKQVIFTDTAFTLTQPDAQQKGKTDTVTGTGLRYHYDTQDAIVTDANVEMPAPYAGQNIYIRAKTIKAHGLGRIDASDAYFTTCDFVAKQAVPHYHVKMKFMQYFANDKVVAWDNRVYINGRFVFWLPVWVIPLKNLHNNLNIGQNEIEGFYLRSFYNYSAPSLFNGYLLNDGYAITNMFEKKGPGLGFEHHVTWGYHAATYLFFYGLLEPDHNNFIPFSNPNLPQDQLDALTNANEQLFGLSGTFFQDHDFGIDHKQYLLGNEVIDGRFEDHNIYNPITPNYRNNSQTKHVDFKDNVPAWGGLNYNLSYDDTLQRGAGTLTTLTTGAPISLTQSVNDAGKANASLTLGNTSIQLSSDYSSSHQVTHTLTPVAASQFKLKQTAPQAYTPSDILGASNNNLSNNFTASTNWDADTHSTLTVPYRIVDNEPAPATPAPPGSSAAPTPMASQTPWTQQAEPQLTVTRRIAGVGNLQLQAYKFLDLTQDPNYDKLAPAQQLTLVNGYNRFEQLPELTLTSDPLFQNFQPITYTLDYGRFFEDASFKPTDLTSPLNKFFPGNYINRFNPAASLSSLAHDIGFNTKLDFGGTGYRQYFYSTGDAQYSVDERARLTTDFTPNIQSDFSYTNNLTPDPKDPLLDAAHTINNSPFQQDKLSLSKQTQITGAFNIHADPYFTYALRGGYDYQNLRYNNLDSELTWRSRVFGLPFGVSLNGQFQPAAKPYLVFVNKSLDLPYLPHVPLLGIDGTWQPVTGTFTLRSTDTVFGGAYGSDAITPGWQLDNSFGYDFNTGLIQSMNNRIYLIFGHDWKSHMELSLGGYYDPTEHHYAFSQIGISKDLHDFILSFQYDRLASSYSFTLTMVAFPNSPLNFGSSTFNRLSAGGASLIGQ